MDNYSERLDETSHPRMSPQRVNGVHKNKFIQSGQVEFILGEACCGQKKDGPQTAPRRVINDAFLPVVKGLGWTPSIACCPQIFKPTPPELETHLHEPYTVAATCDSVSAAVQKAHAEGKFPMLIGGDHCLALGSVHGSFQKFPELRVLWFDAHADVNTPATSPSGNMHGMPLAALMGVMKPPGLEDGRFHCLTPERLGYIGLRDVDAGERETLRRLHVEDVAFGIPELDSDGIAGLTRRVLKKINPDNKFPIHISFDVDGMDPMDAPSTGTPVARGVRLPEALEMLQIVRDTGCLVSMDVVEVNPALGTHNEAELTIANARLVIANALSHI